MSEHEKGFLHHAEEKKVSDNKRRAFDAVAIFTTVLVAQALIPGPFDNLLLPAGAAYWYLTQGHKRSPAVIARGLDMAYEKSEETFSRVFDYVLLSKRQREIIAEISDSSSTEDAKGDTEEEEEEK